MRTVTTRPICRSSASRADHAAAASVTGNLDASGTSNADWSYAWYEIRAGAGAAATSDSLESAAQRQLKQNSVYRMSDRSQREAQQFLRARKAYGFSSLAA